MDAIAPREIRRHSDAARYMPRPAPLRMPVQDLTRPFCDPNAPGVRSGALVRNARLFVFLCAGVTTAGITALFVDWFDANGLSGPEWSLIVVVALTFFWIAFGVAQASLGLFSRRDVSLTGPAPRGDVAILFPVHQEPPHVTFGAIRAMRADLALHGRHDCTIHVLSDTRDPRIARREEEIFAELVHEKGCPVYYRRRAENDRAKVGNVEDWITRWGAGSDAFVVMDADSILTAATLDRLVDTLLADDRLALVQSVPRLVFARSLFGRVQSFANNVYGPLLARGLSAWTGNAGNFWGHNAAIRTKAFAACCGLPDIAGSSALSGPIRSHDFVEAALLRRAGWGVRVVEDANGSFEEVPGSLIDYSVRDRRWAHGNLQHLRLLGIRGLHSASRFHMVQGAFSYLASFGWLALIALWIVQGAASRGVSFSYFDAANPMFPVWPEADVVSKAGALLFVALMLLGPKLLAAGRVLWLDPSAQAHGGPLRFISAVVLEIVVAAVFAPIMMVQHGLAVVRALAGRTGGWKPQNRVGERYGFAALARFHACETLLGLALASVIAAGLASPWLWPVALPLLFAVPLSWLAMQDASAILRTAEEGDPEPVLKAVAIARANLAPPVREDRAVVPVGFGVPDAAADSRI